MSVEDANEEDSGRRISRRQFLKYSAGVAAVAAGATAMLGKIPLPSSTTPKPGPRENTLSDAIVVTVRGDELTVIGGERSVKVIDTGLAAALASLAPASA